MTVEEYIPCDQRLDGRDDSKERKAMDILLDMYILSRLDTIRKEYQGQKGEENNPNALRYDPE
jgi:hypothetical protein